MSMDELTAEIGRLAKLVAKGNERGVVELPAIAQRDKIVRSRSTYGTHTTILP